MMNIDLTTEQSAALKRALELYVSELRMEIADTDRQDFRDGLKQEKALLLDVVAKLGGHSNELVGAGK